ncbi:unnamed protein product [Mesocestoides corti]|uniref:Secreted protein n=1 Tax=Mesocestoides corti TaxID=53468 RepID=A0A0R3U434_MESCO|nr:unnamed protein product [Mesocestoides corti]
MTVIVVKFTTAAAAAAAAAKCTRKTREEVGGKMARTRLPTLSTSSDRPTPPPDEKASGIAISRERASKAIYHEIPRALVSRPHRQTTLKSTGSLRMRKQLLLGNYGNWCHADQRGIFHTKEEEKTEEEEEEEK